MRSEPRLRVEITDRPIVPASLLSPPHPDEGAVVFFSGHIRDREDGAPIEAIDYEAYESMAVEEIKRICRELHALHPIRRAHIVHRQGRVAVGDPAIALAVFSERRREAFAFATEFMDRLKQDVPIWKARAVPKI